MYLLWQQSWFPFQEWPPAILTMSSIMEYLVRHGYSYTSTIVSPAMPSITLNPEMPLMRDAVSGEVGRIFTLCSRHELITY